MSYSSIVLADNPVFYWRLGETTGIVANDEVSTYDAAYEGTPLLGQTGLLYNDAGKCVCLNSAADVSAGANASLAVGTGNFTWELWFKPVESTPVPSDWIWLVNHGGYQYGAGHFILSWHLHIPTCTMGTWYTDPFVDTTAYPLTGSSVYHIVVTRSGTDTMTMYINGMPHNTGTSSADITENYAFLGADPTVASEWMAGCLQEVAFYDYALSPSQVALHHYVGRSYAPPAYSNRLVRLSSGLLAHDAFSADHSANYDIQVYGGTPVWNWNDSGALSQTSDSNSGSLVYKSLTTCLCTSAKLKFVEFCTAYIGCCVTYATGNGYCLAIQDNSWKFVDIASWSGSDVAVYTPTIAHDTWYNVRLYYDIPTTTMYGKVGSGTSLTSVDSKSTLDLYETGVSSGSGGPLFYLAGSCDDLDLRTSWEVTCTDLAAGYYLQVSDGVTTAKAIESSGTAIVDAGAVLFPLSYVAVWDGDPDAGGTFITQLGTGDHADMGGGDVFCYYGIPEGQSELKQSFIGSTADGQAYSYTAAGYATASTVATVADCTDTCTVGQGNDAGTEFCCESFIKFDTSGLPDDALITGATLWGYVDDTGIDTGCDFLCEARIYNWGEAVDTGDFRTPAQLADLTLLATWDTSTRGADDTFYPFVSTEDFKTAINRTGTTYMVIDSSRHVSSTEPATNKYDFVHFSCGDFSDTTRWKLTVSYIGTICRTNLVSYPSPVVDSNSDGIADGFSVAAINGSRSVSMETGRAGGYCQHVHYEGAAADEDTYPGIGSCHIPVVATDLIYTYSAYIKVSCMGCTPILTVNFFNSSDEWLGNIAFGETVGGDWERFYVTYKAWALSTYCTIDFLIDGDMGEDDTCDLYLDDIMVEETGALGSYFDGDSDYPGYTCVWTGTANASTSTATPLATAGDIYTTGGYEDGENASNGVSLHPIILPQAGRITSISVYAQGIYDTNGAFKLVLYSDNFGEPYKFLAQTEQAVIEATTPRWAWTTLELTTPYHAAAGDYWIGIWNESVAATFRNYYRETEPANAEWYKTCTYADPGCPSDGGFTSNGGWEATYYATYVPAVTAASYHSIVIACT